MATTTDGGKTATCNVTVKTSVAGMSLSKTSATIEKGNTLTLTATVAPMDASNKSVTWTSSDTGVATVSSTGVVTAKANGTATIMAQLMDGEHTADCIITVISPRMNEPDFILPNDLYKIEEEAFAGLPMTTVKCPEGLIAIGERAFADCAEMVQIYIPESCVYINKTAFEGTNVALTIFGKVDTAAEMFARLYGYGFVEAE